MAAEEKPQARKTAAKSNPAKPTAKAAGAEGERIAKVLSRAGVASRREAERLIEAGEVTVNGKIITSAALNVTASDKITVSGQPVGAPEPPRLWLYYKPDGLVTSASDEKGRDTVFDHLPEDMPRVMSVGRLDLNSEGLLLLTNDGALKRQLELPSTGWLRKYRVRVKGNPTEPDIEPLRKGIVIDGERFQPMDVKIDRHQGANAWLTVGLREGKNREIRRAMFAIGLTVNRLIRISYGPFRLNEMEPGEVEEIKPRILRDQLGALIAGQIETVESASKPKPRLRTSSRSGGDEGIPKGAPRRGAEGKTAPRPSARGEQDAAPARASRAPASAKVASRGAGKPAGGLGKAAAGAGKPSTTGAVSTPRGRKALGQLAGAWVSATKPGRADTRPGAKPRDEGETAAKPRSSRKSAAPKPSTRNAPAAKPPTRRK